MEIQRLHSSIFSDYLLIIFNCLEDLHRNSMTEELSLVLINTERRNIKNDQKTTDRTVGVLSSMILNEWR